MIDQDQEAWVRFVRFMGHLAFWVFALGTVTFVIWAMNHYDDSKEYPRQTTPAVSTLPPGFSIPPLPPAS